MKYLIVVLDGLSEKDYPTTLEYAKTPNLDSIFKRSEIGLVNCVPKSYSVASDVANMSILGYNPNEYYSGRAYLEAVAQDLDIESDKVLYRANLVKLGAESIYKDKKMLDFSSGNISSQDAKVLIDEINEDLNDDSTLIMGTSYHHLLITDNKEEFNLIPPHEITNEKIDKYFKDITENNYFYKIMLQSNKIIDDRFGATSLWLWSKSYPIVWKKFSDIYNCKGALISAVDALIGIAKLSGLDYKKVDGATGDDKTNYHNKIDRTLSLFDEGYNFVYLHIEACDYCSHQGNQTAKIDAIEKIDNDVFSKILQYENNLRVLILPDHHTSITSKMHEHGDVPMMIYDNRKQKEIRSGKYCEINFDKQKYDVLDLLTTLFITTK